MSELDKVFDELAQKRASSRIGNGASGQNSPSIF